MEFRNFLSLQVADNQREVDLIFENQQDYQNGVSLRKNKHLKVFATTPGFFVKVRSNSQNFNSNGGEFFSASQISVGVVSGTGGPSIQLDTQDQTLYQGHHVALGQEFDIQYEAKGNQLTEQNAIKNSYIGNTFSADIVYSITAK